MQKKYLFLIGAVILLLFGVVLFFAVTQNSKKDTSQTTNTIPDYTLDPQTQDVIKQVAVNFVSLYNTYSSDDVSNITSMGDYQTPEMQQQTVTYANQLLSQLKAGYSIRTTADSNSFSYRYPVVDKIYATVKAGVEERNPEPDGSSKTTSTVTTASLEFDKVGDRWLISSVSYGK